MAPARQGWLRSGLALWSHRRAARLRVDDRLARRSHRLTQSGPRIAPVPTLLSRLKALLLALVVAVVAGALPAGAARADHVDVTLLLASDIYRMSELRGRGGHARLASVVRAERAAHDNLVYVHAGDALSPCLYCSFDKGQHLMALTNITPPDIFVPGNHEFDFGRDVFLQRMSEARFPLFAANLRLADGERVPGFRDTEMRNFGGVKIGFVGATAEDSPEKSNPGDLVIEPVVATVSREAQRLRAAGADIVVAVVHAAHAIDDQLIRSRAADVILSGDDHDLRVSFDGKVAFAESGADADVVTAVDIGIDVDVRDGQRSVSWWPRFRVVDTATVTPDEQVATVVAGYEERLAAELDVPVATLGVPLDTRTSIVRSSDTAFGALVAAAIKDATGADCALFNGGGIRGNRTYAAGSALTRRDVLAELPFGNVTVMVEISGEGLLAALENALSRLPDPSGRFPQLAGLVVEYDVRRPPGSRVLAVKVGDAALDKSATYKLATNDFLLRGAEGFGMLPAAQVLIRPEDGKLVANDVMAYAVKLGRIDIAPGGRLVAR